MRTIIYAIQVAVGGVLGALLGRGASTAASSPSCWRGCCAALAVVTVGMLIFGFVAATQEW